MRLPGCINQTENSRRWGRVGESERESEYGNTTVVLPYVGHQMLNFILIWYVIPLGYIRLGKVRLGKVRLGKVRLG